MALARSDARELVVVAGLTPLYLLARGYSFGTNDHGIHLPYIARARDPDFLPGDAMLDVAVRHSSLFFECFALLSRCASLESLYLVAHVVSVFLMLAGLRALARSLWSGSAGEWAAAVAVAGVFVHRYVIGGIGSFDAVFLPRVASHGPLLLALALGVRGRPVPAFGLIGLVFLFHATTAAHVAVVLWCGMAFGGRRNLHACVLGPLVFLVGAAPLLAVMAGNGGPTIPWPAPPEWVDGIRLHYPFHHFPPLEVVFRRAIPGMLAVLLGIAACEWRGAGRILAGFLVGVLGLFVGGFVGNSVLAWPATIYLHAFQAGRVLDALAIVALGGWSFRAVHAAWPVKIACGLVVASYITRTEVAQWVGREFVQDLPLLGVALMITALASVDRLPRRVVAWAFPMKRRGTPSLAAGYLMVALACAVFLLTLGRAPRWRPMLESQRGASMMAWARGALPEDATVIVPPNMRAALVTFRYAARRRAIGSWKDGGEGTFDYAYMLAWERQLRDLTGIGDRIRVPAGPIRWPEYTARVEEFHASYHAMPAQHFVAVGAAHGASHVVRDVAAEAGVLDLPVVYADDEYRVYALSAPAHTR